MVEIQTTQQNNTTTKHLKQNSMEKTAVEWFANRLTERGLDYSIEDFEQAKEMEEATT